MQRVPEPELMEDPAQARAYAEADFSEPHQAFVEYFRTVFPDREPQRVLDLGCGPADVTLRFARAYPDCRILGVDGSRAMLELGGAAVEKAGLKGRIEFRLARLPDAALPARAFDTVISNSLLHHLRDPLVLWDAVKHCAASGAAVFVVDLWRPDARAQADALVAQYAAAEPDILRRDFLSSLLAAYTPDEITAQLDQAGIGFLKTEVVGDRHVAVHGRLR